MKDHFTQRITQVEKYVNSIWSCPQQRVGVFGWFCWLVGSFCFFLFLNLNQHLKKSFPRSAFLKHLLQDRCLILSSTICDTSSYGSHLSGKLCRVANTLQQEENAYILIPQLLYVAIQKAHEETIAYTSFYISNFSDFYSPFSVSMSNQHHSMLAGVLNLANKSEGLNSH